MMRSDDLLKQGIKLKKKKLTIEDIEETQAVYADYQTSLSETYNRGHLNPKGHHTGKDVLKEILHIHQVLHSTQETLKVNM